MSDKQRKRPARAGKKPVITRKVPARKQVAAAPRTRKAPSVPPKPPKAAAPAVKSEPASAPAPSEDTPQTSFPVVGIGASAGGLEALEAFFQNVTPDSGVAYAVVQHLDPNHAGALPSLLQRAAKIPVVQAQDGLELAANHVYVIPPGYDMSVLHGTLYLLPQATPRHRHLPIDFFFDSLATDQAERSIGVILSGMGHDGTLGLRAIKDRAGAGFVQAPASAKFDSMPRSAIDAGVADVVAPVEQLPARIRAYIEHTFHFGRRPPGEVGPSAIEKIFVLLRAHTGNDFLLYKRSTLQRRIERRMGLHQIDTIDHYARFLRENPREVDLLFKELLIGVTSFFRDPAAWETLQNEILPRLIASHTGAGPLRAWVCGCSTGEEAYTLAMCFREAVEPFKAMTNINLQIFATDLDRDAIDKARQGLYHESIASSVSPERLRRFFVQEERGYRVTKEIREMVLFAPQNAIMDPPFTKLDLLCCRNLLIYLAPELQKKLIPLFHYSLNPGGVLFLGSAEAVGAYANLFQPLDHKSRIYGRLEQPATVRSFEFARPLPTLTSTQAGYSEPEHTAPSSSPALNLERLADRVIVQRFAPVCVLCNDKGDILYLSSRAGKYLEPVAGKANLNIFAMARDGLRYGLSSAFNKATREQRAVQVRGLTVGTNGGAQVVDLTVQRLLEPKPLRGTVIVAIADVRATARRTKDAGRRKTSESNRIYELEADLRRAREEEQSTREEMQTSQEELKSTNEELQSANEELQSTNEELTTSKEEMQSLNEELQTVNHELQAKLDELSRSNNDMKNLLNSTDIATLFLDHELRVRRFTTSTARIIKLIPGDAGRPITDITSELDYAALVDDAREVLRTLVFKEKQCATRDGRYFSVRIMPYRTLENVIDGLVITFTDASAARALEASLHDQASQLRQLVDSLPTLVWGSRADGACDFVNRRWLEYSGATEEELLGTGWLERVHPEDREHVRDGWLSAVHGGHDFEAEFRIRAASGSYRRFFTRAAPIRNAQHEIVKWYGTSTVVAAET